MKKIEEYTTTEALLLWICLALWVLAGSRIGESIGEIIF